MLNLEDMVVSKIGSTIIWTDSKGRTYRQEPFGEDAVKLYRNGVCVAVLTIDEDFIAHEPDFDPYRED